MIGIPSHINSKRDIDNIQNMVLMGELDDKAEWLNILKRMTQKDVYSIPIIEKGDNYIKIPYTERYSSDKYKYEIITEENDNKYIVIYTTTEDSHILIEGQYGEANRLGITIETLINYIKQVELLPDTSPMMRPMTRSASVFSASRATISTRPAGQRYYDGMYGTKNELIDILNSIVGMQIGGGSDGILYIQDTGTKKSGCCYINADDMKLYKCTSNTTSTSLDKSKFIEQSITNLMESTVGANNSIGLSSLEKKYLEIASDNTIRLLANTSIYVGSRIFTISESVVLSASNLDTGSFTVGKDYYVYCCDNGSGAPIFKISLNSTFPSGFTALNSRKIGGFHYGDCRRVNEMTLEPINTAGSTWGSGWEDNVYVGILPFSVYTLLHRPKCNPEGMVYCDSIHKWVDIYLTSTNYKSEYNATPMTGSEGLMHWDWHEKVARRIKKSPLSYLEFCSVADGSPNGRDDNNNYAWSKTTNTGRNKTGIIAKAVSSYGLKDCVGNIWEVGDDISWSTQPGSWGWKDKDSVKKGAFYNAFATDVHIGLHGGNWYYGAFCGSRTLNCHNAPWGVNTHVGCRFACDSL